MPIGGTKNRELDTTLKNTRRRLDRDLRRRQIRGWQLEAIARPVGTLDGSGWTRRRIRALRRQRHDQWIITMFDDVWHLAARAVQDPDVRKVFARPPAMREHQWVDDERDGAGTAVGNRSLKCKERRIERGAQLWLLREHGGRRREQDCRQNRSSHACSSGLARTNFWRASDTSASDMASPTKEPTRYSP